MEIVCDGTRNRYPRGCRCDSCRAFQRDRMRKYYANSQSYRDKVRDKGQVRRLEIVCEACGKARQVFKRGRGLPKYCDNACQRDYEDRGRPPRDPSARHSISRVDRLAVHERCNWTCFCGNPVDRDAVASDPKAPVVDHIVPLARGGLDEPSNWQTAHSICNSHKRDLPMEGLVLPAECLALVA